MANRIHKLKSEGHTPHCARRIAWGDGRCECRRRLPRALVPRRVQPGDTFTRPDNGELAVVTAINGDTVRGLCLDGREREFHRASAPDAAR